MGVNRDKTRQAKLGKFWCMSCDRAYIKKGQKCPVCGNIQQKRNKK